MARKCNTALVEPPVAMITATAFSIASRVTMSRGFRSFLTASTKIAAACLTFATTSSSTLAMVDEYGKLMPSASNDELMVLAVYMPPHEPLPGIARRSIWQKSSSLILPAENCPTASNTLTMLRSWPLYLPGRMVPP